MCIICEISEETGIPSSILFMVLPLLIGTTKAKAEKPHDGTLEPKTEAEPSKQGPALAFIRAWLPVADRADCLEKVNRLVDDFGYTCHSGWSPEGWSTNLNFGTGITIHTFPDGHLEWRNNTQFDRNFTDIPMFNLPQKPQVDVIFRENLKNPASWVLRRQGSLASDVFTTGVDSAKGPDRTTIAKMDIDFTGRVSRIRAVHVELAATKKELEALRGFHKALDDKYYQKSKECDELRKKCEEYRLAMNNAQDTLLNIGSMCGAYTEDNDMPF